MTNRSDISYHYNRLRNLNAQKQVYSDLVTLYALIGESVCMIQILEDALSHSITLKKNVKTPGSLTRSEATEFLRKYRKLTLGQAIKFSKREKIYSEFLQAQMELFLPSRNWIIHKCVVENEKKMDTDSEKNELFSKIKMIGNEAQRIQRLIEVDLEDFSLSVGIDIRKIYLEAYASMKK